MDADCSNSVMLLLDSAGVPADNLVELSSGRVNGLWCMVRNGRRFVFKGLRPELRNRAEYLALLRKEFELGMKLDHPSVVRVWSMEVHKEVGPGIVMEYIDGIPLNIFMERCHPDTECRERIIMQLVDALSYIHEEGVSHRDLKPDNIIVTRRDSRPVLIDFGLGDSIDHEILKRSAATRRYGAPEQLDGACGDERADIYSLGRIMDEMSLPRRYRRIVRRCLSDKPEKRPTSREILTALRGRRSNRLQWMVTGIVAFTALIMSGLLWSPAISNEGSDVAPDSNVAHRDSLIALTELSDSASRQEKMTVAPVAADPPATTEHTVHHSISPPPTAYSASDSAELLYEALCKEALALSERYLKESQEADDMLAELKLLTVRDKKLNQLLNDFLTRPEIAGLPPLTRDHYSDSYWKRLNP